MKKYMKMQQEIGKLERRMLADARKAAKKKDFYSVLKIFLSGFLINYRGNLNLGKLIFLKTISLEVPSKLYDFPLLIDKSSNTMVEVPMWKSQSKILEIFLKMKDNGSSFFFVRGERDTSLYDDKIEDIFSQSESYAWKLLSEDTKIIKMIEEDHFTPENLTLEFSFYNPLSFPSSETEGNNYISKILNFHKKIEIPSKEEILKIKETLSTLRNKRKTKTPDEFSFICGECAEEKYLPCYTLVSAQEKLERDNGVCTSCQNKKKKKYKQSLQIKKQKREYICEECGDPFESSIHSQETVKYPGVCVPCRSRIVKNKNFAKKAARAEKEISISLRRSFGGSKYVRDNKGNSIHEDKLLKMFGEDPETHGVKQKIKRSLDPTEEKATTGDLKDQVEIDFFISAAMEMALTFIQELDDKDHMKKASIDEVREAIKETRTKEPYLDVSECVASALFGL